MTFLTYRTLLAGGAVLAVLGSGLTAAAYQNPVKSFSGASAYSLLTKQVAFGPRNPGSEEHTACLQSLATELRRYTPRVSIQPFLFRDSGLNTTFTLSNIIADFPGENPRSLKIMLAAHWDTRPWADKERDPDLQTLPIAGANDGASGIAVLFEIARIRARYPPPFPVQIVFFDGEDYGKQDRQDICLLGSQHCADNRTECRINVNPFPGRSVSLNLTRYRHFHILQGILARSDQ